VSSELVSWYSWYLGTLGESFGFVVLSLFRVCDFVFRVYHDASPTCHTCLSRCISGLSQE